MLSRLQTHRNNLRKKGTKFEPDTIGWAEKVVEFDRVRIYPCPKEEMDSLEKELILLYDPALNVRKPAHRRVDIEALAARAGVDYEQWKRDYAKYPPKETSGYRRV